MPGTNEEYVRFATQEDLSCDFAAGRTWLDGSEITTEEAADIRALWVYRQEQIERRSRKKTRRNAQRKALKLLRQYLSTSQSDNLRRKGKFYITTPSGNAYRLDARRGRTEQVGRHGQRYFVRRRFCLHEHSLLTLPMPPADLALTHFLLLLADEDEFLALAKATEANDMLWNGQWLRRLREARLQREAGARG